MSYLEKLFEKRDHLEKYIKIHGAQDNQMVYTHEITDRIIQRYLQ